MSSSALVSVTYTEEAKYGETPDAATPPTLHTARFTSESLSGTPTTVESGEIRSDRMSGGQIVTGLEVGGSIEFELAFDNFFNKFFAMGMMSDWQAQGTTISGVDFTPTTAQQGTLDATGIGTAYPNAGELIVLTDANGDSVYFQVISVPSADQLVVASKRDQEAVTGDAYSPAYLDIGKDVASVTLSKAYKDVLHTGGTSEHGQTYSGSIVSGFSIAANFGAVVTGSFDMSGNGYKQPLPSYEQAVVAAGGTVVPAGTSQAINASIDVPVVTASGEATEFCIESFNISLDNGLTPQNCIGHAAPRKYELGTANITIGASIYLGDQSYDKFMPAKLTQEPVSLMFTMASIDGGYAFLLPAVQLSFPDPSSGGGNTPVMIDASGTAKVGNNGESALRIYRL